ncbi:MAG: class I SAM-dependent methyltransferase [Deltaproteobacteria bacterium]|nr:class I SAM-dependent methyltransferase [Deltaproteobacteria bacterium]
MPNDDALVKKQYGIGEIWQKIETGLRLAGKDVNSLTLDDLAPIDEFHTRGRAATREVAEMANLKASDLILDVGCGLGGTARYLAEHYKCQVKGIDLTEEYISAGTKLTEFANLSDRVELHYGSALDLPYENEQFDIVMTQHVQMNIFNKHRFYSEIARVLKPGDRFVFHDVFRSSGKPALYPVPWADDESVSSMVTESQARSAINKMGLEIDQWFGKVPESVKFFERVLTRIEAKGHPPFGIHLILGDNAEEKMRNHARNLSENRLSVVVGVAHKK